MITPKLDTMFNQVTAHKTLKWDPKGIRVSVSNNNYSASPITLYEQSV